MIEEADAADEVKEEADAADEVEEEADAADEVEGTQPVASSQMLYMLYML